MASKKTKKAGAAVKEEHLLSFADMYDNVILDTSACICIQVDIQEAYVFSEAGYGQLTEQKITNADCRDIEMQEIQAKTFGSKGIIYSEQNN